jgi:hypothetical protein
MAEYTDKLLKANLFPKNRFLQERQIFIMEHQKITGFQGQFNRMDRFLAGGEISQHKSFGKPDDRNFACHAVSVKDRGTVQIDYFRFFPE